MPKMKTHHWVGVTLSMKNLFGLMPGIVYGWPKNVFHWAGLEPSILDINATVKPHLAIVDGIVGMEGDGPIMGTPKPAGVLVMGRDLPAVDATAARIMGIDPLKVTYLRAAHGGLGDHRWPKTSSSAAKPSPPCEPTSSSSTPSPPTRACASPQRKGVGSKDKGLGQSTQTRSLATMSHAGPPGQRRLSWSPPTDCRPRSARSPGLACITPLPRAMQRDKIQLNPRALRGSRGGNRANKLPAHGTR